MSGQEEPGRPFGQRHPTLIIVALVFGAGFLLGGLQGARLHGILAFMAGGLLAGIASLILLALLSVVLALPITAVQMISRSVRRRAAPAEKAENSFGRTLMRNLEGAMEFWIQGWP